MAQVAGSWESRTVLEARLEESAAPARERRKLVRRGAGRRLPAKLGEYELFDHVGRGGMADIYRARRQTGFGVVRELCVKEVLPELADSERLASLLVEEAKVAAKLEHSNVVRIEDLRREDGTLFIAMEYVDGVDVRVLLRAAAKRGTRIPLAVALYIAREALRALDFAHGFQLGARKGVVHRDVSPSNVLLSFDGEVKLCDFGIAKSYDNLGEQLSESSLLEGLVEGKAGYMSPEQARGEALDGRADLFALGIILWELLSGRKYYKASEGRSLLDLARRAQPRPLPGLDLPDGEILVAIVERALCRNREDRYGSASEMLEDLETFAAATGLLAGPAQLRRFLELHVLADVREAQRRRALATRALDRGSLAALEPIARPAPPVPLAIASEPLADVPLKPTRRASFVLGFFAIVAACVVAWLLSR